MTDSVLCIEMSIRDVVQEWTVGGKNDSVTYGALADFDKARVNREVDYNQSLKTTIIYRRGLYGFFKYNVMIHGSPEVAFQKIEALQRELGKRGNMCSLSALWKYVRQNKNLFK